MQPPQKKVKYTAALKVLHNEQVTRLKQKHVHELELLEDIRVFAQQRAVIERVYGNALCKAAQQFLNKKTFAIPAEDDNKDDAHRLSSRVWRTVLEETVKVGTVHQGVSEVYLRYVADVLKNFKSRKQHTGKRALERLKALQYAMTQTVCELEKSQKTYSDCEHEAHISREKVIVAEEKLRNRSTGLFTSMASLEKTHAKLQGRKELHETKSTCARNEYILNINASNAHASCFYDCDLMETIEAIEQDMCSKLKEMGEKIADKELECGRTILEGFSKVADEVKLINPDYEREQLLTLNPVLKDFQQYQFEAQDNDPVCTISCDYGQLTNLNKEAAKWCLETAASVRVIKDAEVQLQKLCETVSNGDDRLKFSQLETKRENWYHRIRLARLNKMMAEARLAALELGGVNANQFLHQEIAGEIEHITNNGKCNGEEKLMDIVGTSNGSMMENEEVVNFDNGNACDLGEQDQGNYLEQDDQIILMRENSETMNTLEQSLLDEIDSSTRFQMNLDEKENKDEEEDMLDVMNGCLEPIGEDNEEDSDNKELNKTMDDSLCQSLPDNSLCQSSMSDPLCHSVSDDTQCLSLPDDGCPTSPEADDNSSVQNGGDCRIDSSVNGCLFKETVVSDNSSANNSQHQRDSVNGDCAINNYDKENEMATLLLIKNEVQPLDDGYCEEESSTFPTMANCDAFTSLSRQSCDTPPPLPPPPEIALDSPFIVSETHDSLINGTVNEFDVSSAPVLVDDFLYDETDNSECGSEGLINSDEGNSYNVDDEVHYVAISHTEMLDQEGEDIEDVACLETVIEEDDLPLEDEVNHLDPETNLPDPEINLSDPEINLPDPETNRPDPEINLLETVCSSSNMVNTDNNKTDYIQDQQTTDEVSTADVQSSTA